jgi:hypothetical protein
VSDVDTTEANWNNEVSLVDLDDITPDKSLLADLRKTRITTPATRVLLVLIVLGAGFLGGALVDRWQRPSSSSASSLSSLSSQFRRGGAGGSGGSGAAGGGAAFGFPGAGGAGGATIGTVKLVDGNAVYIQDTAGDDIKVTTSPSTQVTVSKPGTVNDLTVGATITVAGKTSSDGTSVAATSIAPSTGFGRGAGGLGGAGAAPGGNAATGG